jgi:hypothetical protein
VGTGVDAYALLLRSSRDRDMRIEGNEAASDGGVGARQRCMSAICGEGEPHKTCAEAAFVGETGTRG